jgi:predicted transcriptional regulator
MNASVGVIFHHTQFFHGSDFQSSDLNMTRHHPYFFLQEQGEKPVKQIQIMVSIELLISQASNQSHQLRIFGETLCPVWHR